MLTALRSPLDGFGVPTGLYALDPLLAAYRNEVQAQTSAYRRVGAGLIAFGLVQLALSALVLKSASDNAAEAERLRDQGAVNMNNPSAGQFVWGTLLAVFSVAELATGTGLCFVTSSPTPLKNYYRETYTDW